MTREITEESQTKSELLAPQALWRLAWAFLALGLAARAIRYFLRFPLWDDETFLCANFIDRSYGELLLPLEYHQVAPVLFLTIELTAVKLLGFSELVLRLFPFLCGVGSLFLFPRLAGRLVGGSALLFTVAIFAVSYPGVRYAAEAKQYASDLFVALLLFALALDWRDRPEAKRRWLLVAFLPIALSLSYPVVFTAGAISLWMAFRLVRMKEPKGWPFWIAYNFVLASTFLAVVAIGARNQSSAELTWMGKYWRNAFPPIHEPVAIPWWLLRIHTGDFLAFPLGDEHFGSTVTFLCCVVGTVVAVRRRNVDCVLLCLLPAGLHLAAAAMQRYPYGIHVKFAMHLGLPICLLAGLGLATALESLQRWPLVQRRTLVAALLLLAMVAVGCIARDLWHPFKTASDERARSFARWFWFNTQFEGESVCVKRDLGLDFAPGTFSDLSWSAMYLCNQRIYSPRHAAGLPPDWDRVTANQPLRCVLYRDAYFPVDQSALDAWVARMKGRYDLVSRESFSFPRFAKGESKLVTVDAVDVYRFVPRADALEQAEQERTIQ